MGTSPSKEEGTEPKHSQVLTICETEKHRLENTVSHFLLSVNLLQCTATYFAQQLKKNHDTKVGSDEEMYRSAIKVLLASQEMNNNLKKRFEDEFKEFFVTIADVIKKEMRVTLPPGFETFNFLNRDSGSRHVQQHDYHIAVDESIDDKTGEVLLKEELLEMTEKENKILKERFEALSSDIDVRVNNEQVKNLKDEVTKLQADKRELMKQLEDAHKIESKIDHLTSAHKDLKQVCEDNEDLISELRQRADDAENKVKDLTKLCDEKDAKRSKEKTEIDKLQKDLGERETEIKRLKESQEKHTKDMRVKDELILEHTKGSKKLETEIDNLRKNVKSKEEEIDRLKTTEGKLTENCKEKETLIEQLKKDGEIKDNFIKEEHISKKAEKDELESTISAKNERIDSLFDDLRNKNSEINLLISKNKTLNEEYSENYKAILTKIDTLNSEKEELTKVINDLRVNISNMRSKIDDLKTTNREISNECLQKDIEVGNKNSEIAKLKTTNGELTAIRDENAETITKLRNEVLNVKSDIEALNSKLKDLTNKCSELQSAVKVKDSTIGELTSKTKSLTDECLEQSNTITELKARNKDIGIESDGRFGKILQLQDEAERKCKEMHDLSSEKKRIQMDFLEMKAERDKQANELRILKSKMLLRVNLFCHHRSNIITNIEQALMIILKDKIEENQLELNFVQFTDNFDDNGDPTIALCMTTSRIGTDAENAVKDMSMSAKTALLMIHHKDEHALPQQASERVLTSPGFKQLGCITDMAFLSGKGFFPCEINNNSIVRLVNFIRKEGVKHRKHDS